jgi:hypothetical protein
VWKGVFSTVSESNIVLDIAAKVGWLENARERFLNEAKICERLRKQDVNGIPVFIGLFDDIDDRVHYRHYHLCRPEDRRHSQLSLDAIIYICNATESDSAESSKICTRLGYVTMCYLDGK